MEQIQMFDIYQKKGLLPSLGSSDDIYIKLKESAKDISDSLSKEPAKIITYTLVAFDNDIPESEPVLEEVEKFISAKWQMLRSHFREMPIVLYRSIILEALSSLVLKETKYASIIWFTAIDVYPLLNIAHKEQEILKIFLDQIGDYVEDIAIKEWTIEKDTIVIKIPKLDLKLVDAKVTLDENKLLEYMIASSGPNGSDGQPRPNPNIHWPNAAQNWSYQFAPRAASGITTVVNSALTLQTDSLNKNTGTLQQSLTTFFSSLEKNMQTALKDSIQSSMAVERRSQLLWWKETLYSKALHKSYRKMSPFESSIAMAFDLFVMLPDVFPVSVDYILKEAYSNIHNSDKGEIVFSEFLQELNKNEHKDFLETYFTNEVSDTGRMDLLSFMQKIIYSKTDIVNEIIPALGIASSKNLTYDELSVWILHCLSAKHLAKP